MKSLEIKSLEKINETLSDALSVQSFSEKLTKILDDEPNINERDKTALRVKILNLLGPTHKLIEDAREWTFALLNNQLKK